MKRTMRAYSRAKVAPVRKRSPVAVPSGCGRAARAFPGEVGLGDGERGLPKKSAPDDSPRSSLPLRPPRARRLVSLSTADARTDAVLTTRGSSDGGSDGGR
eukprot:6171916-Pleurochrysis_carterae.AAC.1